MKLEGHPSHSNALKSYGGNMVTGSYFLLGSTKELPKVVMFLVVLIIGTASSTMGAGLNGLWETSDESAGTYCGTGESFFVDVVGDKFHMTQVKGEVSPYRTFNGILSGRTLSGVVSMEYVSRRDRPIVESTFKGALTADETEMVLSFTHIIPNPDYHTIKVTCKYRRSK